MSVELLKSDFSGPATDTFIVSLMVLLSGSVLATLINLRRKIRQIYLDYYTPINEQKDLKLRTAFLIGEPHELAQLNDSRWSKSILARIIIPEFTHAYSLVSNSKKLRLSNRVYTTKRLNCLSLRFMPDKVTNRAKFNTKVNNWETRAFQVLSLPPKHSNFAFICFRSLIDLKRFKKYYEEAKNHNLKCKFFVEWNDIIWSNIKPRYKAQIFMNYLFKFLIFLLLLFLSSPAVVLNIIRQSNLIDTSLLAPAEANANTRNTNFFEYLLRAFLPPLIIIVINQLLLLAIVRLSILISKSREKAQIYQLSKKCFAPCILLCIFEYGRYTRIGCTGRNKPL
jgi:hypothetical protein